MKTIERVGNALETAGGVPMKKENAGKSRERGPRGRPHGPPAWREASPEPIAG